MTGENGDETLTFKVEQALGSPSVRGAAGKPPSRYHFEFIDGLRALCALFVLVGHTWFQPTTGFYQERWMNRLGLSYGHIAVVVFIVVSGFVIVFPIIRRDDEIGSLSQFLYRRSRRILPPYYAALLLSCFFIWATGQEKTGTVWDTTLPLTLGQFLTHLGMVNNWPLGVEGGLIGYQFWSIAVEFQIYLLCPLLVLGTKKLGYWPLVTLCTLLTAAFAWFLPGLKDGHVWFVALFMFGAGAARMVARRPELATRAGLLGLVLLAGLLGLTVKQGNAWYTRHLPWMDIGMGAGAALLIAGIAAGEGALLGLLKRVLSVKPLVWVGSFSYSLYLVHAALLHVCWLVLSRVAPAEPKVMFLQLLLCAPLIVGMAYPFFLLFERPFMRPAPAPAATEPLLSAAPVPKG